MIRLLAAALCTLCAAALFAQTDTEPVAWTFTLGEDGGVHAVLAQADVADGWYVYSQFIGDGGPIATTLDLSATPGIELRGEAVEEGDEVSGFDEMFEMEITKFKHRASFTQALTLPAGAERVVGTIEYMACTKLKCLPPRTLDIALAVN